MNDDQRKAIVQRLKEIEAEVLYHNEGTEFGDGIQMIRDLRDELERGE